MRAVASGRWKVESNVPPSTFHLLLRLLGALSFENVTLKPERVLRQFHVHAVVVGADGFDFGDDSRQRVALEGVGGSFHELVDRGGERDFRAARAARDGGEVGDAGSRV